MCCTHACCSLVFLLATCMTEQTVKIKKHSTLRTWITRAVLFQKCCHECSRSIKRCSQNSHPALKNLQKKCHADFWRNSGELYTVGENLERETGMFYNGSFHENERDTSKHQIKASLKTNKRIYFFCHWWMSRLWNVHASVSKIDKYAFGHTALLVHLCQTETE